MAKDPRDTPAMRQHAMFKQRHPDCVLLFRMGDFYELFDEDAHTGNRVLGLTLTQRTSGLPMAGVPAHAVDGYVRRLIDAGHRVALCDQVQDPSEAKGVVQRAVTRVLTPGTLVEDELLGSADAAALAALCFLDDGDAPNARVALAIVDVSTGSFAVLDTTAASAPDELMRAGVRELIAPSLATGDLPDRARAIAEAASAQPTARPSWEFGAGESLEAIKAQFGVSTLAGFGLEDTDDVVRPAGAIVRYLRETHALDAAAESNAQNGDAERIKRALGARTLAHLKPPVKIEPSDGLIIDAVTLRALEIERTVREGSVDGSLLGLFSSRRSSCRTAMGRRRVREWLCRPLREITAIEARQSCVAALVGDRRLARELGEMLCEVQDVARIGARLALDRASPRDLCALGRSVARAAPIAELLRTTPAFAKQVDRLDAACAATADVCARIDQACVDDPPAHLREGGLVRDGVDAELDEARGLERDAGAWLGEYQSKLSAEHDLPSLKVGFNKVFGYYIELPKAQAKRAPDVFTRRQTLTNAERYITPELKQFEDKVLGASERGLARERAIFAELCDQARSVGAAVGAFGEVAAELDALACFADRAAAMGWTRPAIIDGPVLELDGARHPVLEESLDGRFVPNDCTLGGGRPALGLITGPNMAGKSTYIRQVALLTVLAHTGSFVPAEEGARVGLTDRVFARVGADDALHRGQSTFMVEMTETANILHHATGRSLVVLDEIGRGTSTLDGLALAWAVAERLAGANGADAPRALFATHYHELTALAERLPDRVMNLCVTAKEWGDEIVFVHRVEPGAASGSFGVQVARLAGVPSDVITRASELLESLSVSHAEVAPPNPARTSAKKGTPDRDQLGLFAQPAEHPVVGELRELKLESMSPLDAFDALRALQSRACDSQSDRRR